MPAKEKRNETVATVAIVVNERKQRETTVLKVGRGIGQISKDTGKVHGYRHNNTYSVYADSRSSFFLV
jgi:hypothetical protein